MNKNFEITETTTEKDVVCGILEINEVEAEKILSKIYEIEQAACSLTATYNDRKDSYDVHLPEGASESAKKLYNVIKGGIRKECWEFYAKRIAILNAIGAPVIIINNEKNNLAQSYVLEQFSNKT